MPVNDFAHYPMAWKPDKNKLRHPIYLSLAEQLEQAILDGKLLENVKLPPQRELADFLDLNLSTITKAYKICEEKGLIYATVGRGTYISPHINVPTSVINQNVHSCIEMGIVQPYHEDNKIICDVARKILATPFAERYFDYSYPLGTPAQREIARQWLQNFNITKNSENIIITAGAQNALSIILTALFQSGDKIATDSYTYPNFIGLANMLGIQLVSVKDDERGMNPSELQKICKTSGIKGLYLMPSCNNPTNFNIGLGRRTELADIIKQEQLILVEDDTYAFLSDIDNIPMTTLIPEQSIYISGLSKSISAGLRIAYLVFPKAFKKDLEQGFYNLNLKTPSFNIEIATEIIRSNLCKKILQNKRERSIKRNKVYAEIFQELSHSVHPTSYFQWLPLPKQCSGRAFEALATEKGVCVYGSERFSVGNIENGCFIRIATSSPASTNELYNGLEIIKKCYLNFGFRDITYIIQADEATPFG